MEADQDRSSRAFASRVKKCRSPMAVQKAQWTTIAPTVTVIFYAALMTNPRQRRRSIRLYRRALTRGRQTLARRSQAAGAASLRAIADGLNAQNIPTARAMGNGARCRWRGSWNGSFKGSNAGWSGSSEPSPMHLASRCRCELR
jgi:hypothetical protein